jgi:hypothetical protein
MAWAGGVTLPKLLTGVHQHYKGPLYLPLGYGHDANIAGREGVVYLGLELDDAHPGPRLAFRTATTIEPDVDAWWDYLHVRDRSKCQHHSGDGACKKGLETVPRFGYLGPGFEPYMLGRVP